MLWPAGWASPLGASVGLQRARQSKWTCSLEENTSFCFPRFKLHSAIMEGESRLRRGPRFLHRRQPPCVPSKQGGGQTCTLRLALSPLVLLLRNAIAPSSGTNNPPLNATLQKPPPGAFKRPQIPARGKVDGLKRQITSQRWLFITLLPVMSGFWGMKN